MADVFIRKQKILPGKTERLREWIAKMDDEADSDSQGVQDIWSAESLHTISLFVEHAADGDYFVWYLEAESMEQLVDARRSSTHPLHDVEDEMMADVLEDPEETGDFEPLLHGVSRSARTTLQLSGTRKSPDTYATPLPEPSHVDPGRNRECFFQQVLN